MNIVSTMTKVVEKLIADGKITFNGNYKAVVGLILVSKERFLKSSLWLKIRQWYAKDVDARGLKFTFKDKELDRGDGIFSYGKKYLWSYSYEDEKPSSFGSGRFGGGGVRPTNNMCWGRAFKDRDRLMEIMEQMRQK